MNLGTEPTVTFCYISHQRLFRQESDRFETADEGIAEACDAESCYDDEVLWLVSERLDCSCELSEGVTAAARLAATVVRLSSESWSELSVRHGD